MSFEFEDVIVEVDGADRLDLVDTRLARRSTRWFDRFCPRVAGLLLPPLARSVRGYELVFVVLQGMHDVLRLWPIDGLLRTGSRKAFYIGEAWRHGLERRRGELAILRRADHIFVGCHASVGPLHELTGRPVTYLPPSTDTLRWCPADLGSRRPIDLLWFGRREASLHAALDGYARQRGLFYLFDTAQANPQVDVAEHRTQFMERIRHSRYAVVQPAKIDRSGETQAQQEIGFRYFEAAAAGAVMIGSAPTSVVFGEHFGWPDAVVNLGDHPERALDELEGDPLRQRRIAARNIAESLRRHDGAHRWRAVLGALDLPARPRLNSRIQAASERAGQLDGSMRPTGTAHTA
jgi:hypothetical protein